MSFSLATSPLTANNDPSLDEPTCVENDLDINDPACLENDDDYQACLIVLAGSDSYDTDPDVILAQIAAAEAAAEAEAEAAA